MAGGGARLSAFFLRPRYRIQPKHKHIAHCIAFASSPVRPPPSTLQAGRPPLKRHESAHSQPPWPESPSARRLFRLKWPACACRCLYLIPIFISRLGQWVASSYFPPQTLQSSYFFSLLPKLSRDEQTEDTSLFNWAWRLWLTTRTSASLCHAWVSPWAVSSSGCPSITPSLASGLP